MNPKTPPKSDRYCTLKQHKLSPRIGELLGRYDQKPVLIASNKSLKSIPRKHLAELNILPSKKSSTIKKIYSTQLSAYPSPTRQKTEGCTSLVYPRPIRFTTYQDDDVIDGEMFMHQIKELDFGSSPKIHERSRRQPSHYELLFRSIKTSQTLTQLQVAQMEQELQKLIAEYQQLKANQQSLFPQQKKDNQNLSSTKGQLQWALLVEEFKKLQTQPHDLPKGPDLVESQVKLEKNRGKLSEIKERKELLRQGINQLETQIKSIEEQTYILNLKSVSTAQRLKQELARLVTQDQIMLMLKENVENIQSTKEALQTMQRQDKILKIKQQQRKIRELEKRKTKCKKFVDLLLYD